MCLAMSMAGLPSGAAENGHADLPPSGYSRFDQLIGHAPVPYPFSRMVEIINRQMVPDPGGLPPLKVTLIPLGRSLQRDAGAPDFFQFPRVVAAADGDTRAGIPPLKDRLFLGYHEKGNVLEVISYNDHAGRFEFQVVRDYQAGKTPQVFYARRSLCLACHQNDAPIFARPLWDETPANPAIAQRLRQSGRDFYGVKLAGTDIAYFIDNATDRANLFSVWQTLWQQGCGTGEAGDRCRMAALSAALDYARFKTLPIDNAIPALGQHWQAHWPNGLAIPNPDLPNRNPLAALPDSGSDPLLLRPPLATWHAPDLTAFVVGLAGMLDPGMLKALGRRDTTTALDTLRARGELASRPFNVSIMQALLRELRIRYPVSRVRLPVARAEPAAQASGPRALFRTLCASCHDTSLPHPPNFLRGSPAQVEANLTQCAPRIFVRLSMAKRPESVHVTSPMPPASALIERGIAAPQWARSPELISLLRDIQTRLPDPATERWIRQPYRTLPPCLPLSAYQDAPS